jgi:hypothetical protein
VESSTAVTQPSLTREETGTLLGQTMGLVAVTTGLFPPRDPARPLRACSRLLLGADRADRLRDRPDLRPDPERPADLRHPRAGDLRRPEAFDFQRLRRTRDIRAAPQLAASIFLDILNVFLLLLSLFGRND